MKESTGFKSNTDLLEGPKLYVQRAKLVLPILVRQARAGETIFYSDLAKEVGMPNPRNLNFVLGAIGNAIITLEKRLQIGKIPLINCIVINQTNHLPGDGINFFISRVNFEKLTKCQKKEALNRLLAEIYSYPNWERVLLELNLKPIKIDFARKFKPMIDRNKTRKSSGESQQHIDFKEFLALHPETLGVKSNVKVEVEYLFPSLDAIDIRFETKSEIIGIEVKSSISDLADILRGLFQCVKYLALLTAEQKVDDKKPNCKVILALQNKFPEELTGIKNLLGIEVVDNIAELRFNS
jgi:hypothetical protein